MPTKYHLNGKEINLTSDNTTINSTNFSVDKDGNMSCSNANITGGQVTLFGEPNAENPTLKIINQNQPTTYVDITSGRMHGYGDGFLHTIFYYNIGTLNLRSSLGTRSLFSGSLVSLRNENDEPVIQLFNDDGSIKCVSLTQTSREESKKNFERLENGLDIVKNTDIYKYNLKSQKDTDKKHIGFVIGDNYNYSQEITSQNNDGVDTYSMVSVAYKAIQEQQELIEQLQKEIKELKGEK